MFTVLFEVNPHTERFDDYLGEAKLLKPELEGIDGFIANIRYRSLTREGWILSVSDWRDEKALVRWRTKARHHETQARGRDEILADYHLRVGQITYDTDPPAGHDVREQRLDETAVGATTIVVTTGQRPADDVIESAAQEIAEWLGLDPEAAGLVDWDVYDAVLDPGDVILMTSWEGNGQALGQTSVRPAGTRTRRVRVIRDYGLTDRREAPQYYPDVLKSTAGAS